MPDKRTLGLAVAQVGGIEPTESRESATRRLVALMRTAHRRGATFVVYPELTLTTFFPRYRFDTDEELDAYFESTMPSDVTQPLFDCARELGVGFYLGYAELTPDGRRFNTAILVDKSGRVVGRYRKIHLPGHADFKDRVPAQHLEKRYFEVGDLGFGVFDTFGVNVGMALCNDRRWPEVYRMLSLQSAELVAIGYNTPSKMIDWDDEPHQGMFYHLLSLQAGAYQNSLWVAAAGKCGYEGGHHMIGGSVIIAPSGEIVAKSSTENDEVIVADIDLDMGERFRQHVFDFAAHRRPEEYGLIVERVGRGDPLPRRGDAARR